MAPPTVAGRGSSDDPKAVEEVVVTLVEKELSHSEAEGVTDTHRIAQTTRRVVGRWVADTYRRPMIVPPVIPV